MSIDVKEGSKYSNMLNTLSNKWEHTIHTDDELKQIAMDLYHNKFFSNFHIPEHSQHMITSVFMVLIFMGHISWDTEPTRENKIIKIMLGDLEKGYKERYNNWINNAGMLYEYYDKAAPTSVNGYPTFFSMRTLSIDDKNRMFEFYNKYKNLQEEIKDKF